MNDIQLMEASKLWNEGVIGPSIAATYGMRENDFWRLTKKRRDLFPRRERGQSKFVAKPAKPKYDLNEVVRWTTMEGAVVTLPRVRFLGVVSGGQA